MKKYLLISVVFILLFSLLSCKKNELPDTVITVQGYIEYGKTVKFILVQKGNGTSLCNGEKAVKNEEANGSIDFRTDNSEINIQNDGGEFVLRRTTETLGNVTVMRQFRNGRIILKTLLIGNDIDYTEEYYESGNLKLRTVYENGIIKKKFRYDESGNTAKNPEYQ